MITDDRPTGKNVTTSFRTYARAETTALVTITSVNKHAKVGLFYYVWYQGVNGTGHWNGTWG